MFPGPFNFSSPIINSTSSNDQVMAKALSIMGRIRQLQYTIDYICVAIVKTVQLLAHFIVLKLVFSQTKFTARSAMKATIIYN